MKRTKSAVLLSALVAAVAVAMGCELLVSPDSDLKGSTGQGAAGQGGEGGLGGGGSGGAGGLGGGGAQPCSDPEMCPGVDDACSTRTCENGVCGFDFTAEGTPVPRQTAEDCQLAVCDGDGQTITVPDDTDPFDDGNACTDDGCNAGVPTNVPSLAGLPCSVGNAVFCDGNGACVECLTGPDCPSGVCTGNACVPPDCLDTVLNGTETDVDCGGSCPPCVDGDDCQTGTDCVSGVCDPILLTCSTPTCADTVQNQDESDADCGGITCSPCGPGLGCGVDGDCIGGLCSGSVCLPTCTDGAANQDETDIDCGGLTCAGCPNGAGCIAGADCLSNLCSGGSCAACFTDNDCSLNEHCGGNVCLPDLGVAALCLADGECLTGQCEDGVCCATDCSGTCAACTAGLTGVADGLCSGVIAGTDPQAECALSSCTTGTCNGSGACGIIPAGTTCGSALSCAGSTQTNQDACDTFGVCADNGTTVCDPYICGGTTCKTSCVTTADCVSGSFCNAGVCSGQKPQGGTCSTAVECTTNNCVDGFCCNSACSSTCQACGTAKTGLPNGTCGNVTTSTDPDNECASVPCQTGTCNGTGACGLLASGTTCGTPLSCSGTTQTNQDTCNAAGACIDNGVTPCLPFACGSTTCKTACVTTGDCASGNYCSAGTCLPQKAQGAVCGSGAECFTGSCVDGVCCSAPCVGVCKACTAAKTGVADGTCSNVSNAIDPDAECADGVACQTGTCNGAGACGISASGATCGSALSCSAGTQVNQDLCNAAGSCIDNGSTTCSPYVCGPSTCLTSCSTSVDCASTFYCKNSVCTAQKPQGSPCTSVGECLSGACVDGFCCTSACTNTCQACSNAKTGAPNGACTNVKVATDPDSECADGVACQTGTCNGVGACGVSASGAACGDVLSCSGATQTNADACDAAGTCVDNGTLPCAPYTCGGTTCKTSCLTFADCSAGAFCSGGLCVQTLPLGGACSTDVQCGSGHCVDSVCCGSTCTGSCLACSAAKTGTADGTCTNVLANSDPDSECASSACATGTCNGLGACGVLGSGTACGSALSCAASVQTNQDTCDASGTCIDNGTVGCAPYGCGAATCNTSCVTAADCAAPNFCVAGVCQASLPQGAVCASNAQCGTGNCVDGFCCASACSGACQACAAAKTGGLDGVCSSIIPSTDPDGECASTECTTGTCDATGACGSQPPGTLCGDVAACAAGLQTNQDTCNGSGTCTDQGTTSCGAFACGGVTCLSSCTLDTDCASGNHCAGGACVPVGGQGSACSADNQCGSGHCVDSVCCNTTCTGGCQACSAAKTGGADGVCNLIPNGNDPDNECTTATCTSGACNGAGACGFLTAGTACGNPGSCAAGIEIVADMCDGTGSCLVQGTTKQCGAYACGATACNTTCTLDADCAGGLVCSGGVCSATCGDGATQAGETCDDANSVGGDGCSATCDVEAGWSCSGPPTLCTLAQEIDCSDGLDNDGDLVADCADIDCALGCNATAFNQCLPGQTLVVLNATDVPFSTTDFQYGRSVLNVGVAGIVRKAGVAFDIQHTNDGNLDITLVPPHVILQPLAGNVSLGLDLSSDNGLTNDNFTFTELSDQCATLISSGSAPFLGCFRPEQPLALVDGSNAMGPWRLNVSDDASPDAGAVTSFSLALCLTTCGDSVVATGEGCDDGNLTDGDGCSSACTPEAGRTCTGSPSSCSVTRESVCNDGTDDDGDSLIDCADSDCALGCSAVAFGGGCVAGQRLVVARSTGAAAALPDRGGLVSSIAIPTTGAVGKTAVSLDLTHTNDADVDLYLLPPNGFPVDLSTDNGGTGDNFTGTQLSDSCATLISSGAAPFAGCFRPEDAMGPAFNGTDAKGDWRLLVTDDTTTSTGTLTGWTLAACVATCGDGITAPGESCDDGDATGGDGCSATCQLEAGYTCVGPVCTRVRELECNDNVDNDGDGLVDCADTIDCALGCDVTAFGGGCALGERLLVATMPLLPGAIGDLEHTSGSLTFFGGKPVTKAAVKFDVTHSFDSDLDFTFAAPSGVHVDLMSDNLSSNDNFVGTTLSDACSPSIVAAPYPPTGCFAPEEPMSLLQSNLGGVWRLDVFDDGFGDTGSLTSFQMAVCTPY